MTSIIITYHDEPLQVLNECLEQLRATIDIEDYEIIIIDDHSSTPLPVIEGVKVIRNQRNVGVGQSFDVGVKEARGEYLFIMACDIRFIANKWASLLLTEIQNNPTAFTCTTCIGLNKYSRCCNTDIVDGVCFNPECSNFNKPALDNMDFERRRNIMRSHGATMLVFHDQQSNPKKDSTYKSILEAKWQPLDKTSPNASYEIPCILGAFYGVSKAWYNYIDGWWGHRQWGTLEPYISLKSWLFGGSCRLAPHIETGHIFKKTGTHGIKQDNIYYNKILVATLLLDEYERLIDFLPKNNVTARAKQMISENGLQIVNKIVEYENKHKLSFKDYCDRFNIDLRHTNPLSHEYDSIYSRKEHYRGSYKQSPYLKVWNKVAEYIEVTDTVVDFGCGTGQMMELLQDKGIKQYIGYDFSHVAINMAQAKTKNNSLVYCQDLYKLSFLPDADKYIAIEVMEHLVDDLKVLKLIPKRKFVIITVPSYLGGSHVRKFDTEQEIIDRYKDTIKVAKIDTIEYGTGKIFVLAGNKI